MAKQQKKNRISVDGSNSSANINNPFASLEITGLPEAQAQEPTPAEPTPPPQAKTKLGRVVLRREKAHRGGKTVIVIYDFAPHVSDTLIEELARKLRIACGCGGTIKDRAIEIQGDQPAKIRTLLESEGFRVAGIS